MLAWISINTSIRKCYIRTFRSNTDDGCFFRIGSGRVTFDNSSSFLHAVSTAFGKRSLSDGDGCACTNYTSVKTSSLELRYNSYWTALRIPIRHVLRLGSTCSFLSVVPTDMASKSTL
jgi:hypothetical protein